MNDARRVKLKLQMDLAKYLFQLNESAASRSVQSQQQEIVVLDNLGNPINDPTLLNETFSQIPQYVSAQGESSETETFVVGSVTKVTVEKNIGRV